LIFWYFLNNSAIGFGGYIISAILIGCAMTKIIENPALKLRDKLLPRGNDRLAGLVYKPSVSENVSFVAQQ
jgi:hypothetical protein